jgi:hypothetical protein
MLPISLCFTKKHCITYCQKNGYLFVDFFLQEGNAALAPLTVTYEREKVIDFTKPYINMDREVLIRKDLGINNIYDLVKDEKVSQDKSIYKYTINIFYIFIPHSLTNTFV